MPATQLEQNYLVRLLSAVINVSQPPVPPENLNWEKLYQFSARNGLANMAWYGLARLDQESQPDQRTMAKFQLDCKKAIAKEATQHLVAEQILQAFEENQIDCMPLKGYLVKYLYPRPDMRLMADVDILFKDAQTEQVLEKMLELGFSVEHQGGYHDIYYRHPFMNVEMHRRLMDEDSPYSEYLNKTWDRAKLKDGSKFTYQLSQEDFYIYLLIHLTKHYTGIGTGIRSFLDIWLYNKRYRGEMDWAYIQVELEKTRLWEFAKNINGLCAVWFGNAQSNELYDEMTGEIFSGGIYGSRKRAIISSINIVKTGQKNASRTALYLYRLELFFPPLRTMKILYPFLETLPFLLPFCWAARGVRSLILKRKHMFQTIKRAHSVSKEDLIRIRHLHQKAGL